MVWQKEYLQERELKILWIYYADRKECGMQPTSHFISIHFWTLWARPGLLNTYVSPVLVLLVPLLRWALEMPSLFLVNCKLLCVLWVGCCMPIVANQLRVSQFGCQIFSVVNCVGYPYRWMTQRSSIFFSQLKLYLSVCAPWRWEVNFPRLWVNTLPPPRPCVVVKRILINMSKHVWVW